MRHLTTSERGAALVEMAIVLPLLLMLVFGIIEFGRAYNAQVSLTHAAREGVREYAITGDPVAGQDRAKTAASSLGPDLMTFTTTPCNPGDQTTLRIEYPFQMRIAFFPVTTWTMHADGVMRCGG